MWWKCFLVLVWSSGWFYKLVCSFSIDSNLNQCHKNSKNCHHNRKNVVRLNMVVELEVEEKFIISSMEDIEQQLKKNGFSERKKVEFTDVYYDIPQQFYPLSLNDYWLRYRYENNNKSSSSGIWQLKCRIPSTTNNDNNHVTTTTTVYQEYQGDEALERICIFLQNINNEKNDDDDGGLLSKEQLDTLMDCPTNILPMELVKSNVQAFAKFTTIRSSWNQDTTTMSVDLDGTDFGHVVGEVEMIVSKEEDIPMAKQKIQQLLQTLEISSDNNSAAGKLETYLQKYNPTHYNACHQAGIL